MSALIGGPEFQVNTFLIPIQQRYYQTPQPMAINSNGASGIDSTRQVLFIDSNVQNYQQLVHGITPNQGIDVVILQDNHHEIDQITQTLGRYKNLSAVHFVTHGADGAVLLGETSLDGTTIKNYAQEIQTWKGSLSPRADLLFYGCDVAAGPGGQGLLQTVAQLTGADVAASSNETGNPSLGGDWVLEFHTGAIETAVPFSAAVEAKWNGLLGVTSPGINVTGSTFLVSEDNSVLRINSLTGAVVATYSTGLLNDGATFGPDGSLYVADYYGRKIFHYDATGAFKSSFGTTGTPAGLAFGPDGNLYVTTTYSTVEKYSPTGTSLGTFITAGSGGLSNAKAIVWGPDGNAYVSSYNTSEVIRYNGITGVFLNVFATGSGGFEDITFGPDKNLYVASYWDGAVYRFNGSTGTPLGTFVSGLATPYGLRFNLAGNLDVSSRTPGQIGTYNGSTGAYLSTLVSGLTNPAFMTSTTSLVTTEMGTTATFLVALTSQPTGNVTINLAASVPGQGSLSQSTLTFDASNWNFAQTVTVTGLDDGLLNGDQHYQITGMATSTDANYNGLAMAAVSVVNKEADSILPVAKNDSFNTYVNTPLNVASPGILANDTRPPALPLTAVLVSGPSHGSLTLNANGSFTYTPNANYFGSDSFTYRANDGLFNSNIAIVSLTVKDLPPVANNDSFATNVNTPLNIKPSGVLGNDTDPQGRSLIAVLVMGPTHGSLTLASDGGFTYTPAANYLGSDSFTYQANDGLANSNVATVSLTTNALPPVATNDSFSTNVNTPLNVIASGVLGNDTDPQGRSLNVVLVTGPTHGSLILASDGGFKYTPAANYLGPDSFTYQANDGLANSNVATVSLTINALTPVANNDYYNTNVNTPLNVVASGVLANDTDPQARPLTVTLISGPSNGSMTLNANGSFTYTPNANYFGLDSFTYQANDGLANSNVATVSLTINALPPVATNDYYSTNINTPLNVVASGVLANDSDPQGRQLSALLVNGPKHGSLTLNANGSFTYTANASYLGTDSFTYQADDGIAFSKVATVYLKVNSLAGFSVTPTSLQTSKAGASASFSVVLTSQPVTPVTINLRSSNPAEGSLSSSSLTFNTGNWNIAQTVTVMGLDDGLTNGNPIYQISGTASSSDSNYNGLSILPITVTNTGNTVLVVDAPLTGHGATIHAATGNPFTGVIATFTDADPRGAAGNYTALIDWGDGHHSVGTIASVIQGGFGVQGSYTYTQMGSYTVTVSIRDVGGAWVTAVTNAVVTLTQGGFVVTPITELVTTNSGGTAAFAVVLTSKPSADVTITISSGNPTEGKVSTSILTFTPDNWNVGQKVTVTGAHGSALAGNIGYSIHLAAVSIGDPSYNGLGPVDVFLVNQHVRVETPGQPAGQFVIPFDGNKSDPPVFTVGPGASGHVSFLAVTSPLNLNESPSPARAPFLFLDGHPEKPGNQAKQVPSIPLKVQAKFPEVEEKSKPGAPHPDAPVSRLALPPFQVSPKNSPESVHPFQTSFLQTELQHFKQQIDGTAKVRVAEGVMIMGAVASVGYVLLSSRASLWLLSVLTARPLLWKRFDPVDILFAWEDEKNLLEAQDLAVEKEDESLQSLVV